VGLNEAHPTPPCKSGCAPISIEALERSPSGLLVCMSAYVGSARTHSFPYVRHKKMRLELIEWRESRPTDGFPHPSVTPIEKPRSSPPVRGFSLYWEDIAFTLFGIITTLLVFGVIILDR
jgi:hypothetical protein